jgi:dolichyl-diphosphooligosaccharide--protein glycosyltransferase
LAVNTQRNDTDGILEKLRITRLQAIEVAVLGIVAIVAILIRVQPLQYGAYFTAFDPLFQYRATEYVVENGFAAWWSWHDTMSWFPMGRNVANSAYPGIPFTAAFVYGIAKIFLSNLTVYDVGLYFPVFAAAVTCITIYFLGKDLAGKPTGLFAALFMAINPAYIRRTSLGFFDTENIGIFAIVATSLFFLRANDDQNSVEKRVVYSVLSGLSLGYLYASWGAAKYMSGLLILYMFLLVVTAKYETKHLISYSITIGLGFLVVTLTPRLGPTTLMGLDSLAAFGVVIALLAYEFVKEKIDIGMLSLGAAGALILAVAAIYVLPLVGIDIPIGFKFIQVLNPFTTSESHLYNSVAENHVTAWTSFFTDYGMILVLGIFGAWVSIQETDEKNLYALALFVTSVYFAGVMSRLTQILAAPACLMGGYGLVKAVTPFLKTQTIPKSRSAKRKLSAFGVSQRLVYVLMGFMLIAMIPSVQNAIDTANSPTQLASSSISVKLNGEYPKDWPQALEWMQENVGDNEVVCSWWDYGYWIEAIAGKTTMADGATQTTRQISTIGKIMMLQPNQSLPILERYGADYIVVFNTYDPNTGQQWPFGDNVKWQWMVNIGGLDLDDYVNFTAGVYKDAFLESTVVHLMYQQPTPEFTQEFVSENGFVLVYSINYDES